MPNWRPINRGFAMTRGAIRSRAVVLWYADDIDLVNGVAPNSTALFTSFGLPPLAAPAVDLDLPGAIVVDHQMVGACVEVNGLARAIVAVFYDNAVRFRLNSRVQTYITTGDPQPFNVPLLYYTAAAGGALLRRRDEYDKIKRSTRNRVVIVRTSGNLDALDQQAATQHGRMYIFGGVRYLFVDHGIRTLDNGELEITYRFWTNSAVRAVVSGTFGNHVALPPLGPLDEYAPRGDVLPGVVEIKLAINTYEAGSTLPGGIG